MFHDGLATFLDEVLNCVPADLSRSVVYVVVVKDEKKGRLSLNRRPWAGWPNLLEAGPSLPLSYPRDPLSLSRRAAHGR